MLNWLGNLTHSTKRQNDGASVCQQRQAAFSFKEFFAFDNAGQHTEFDFSPSGLASMLEKPAPSTTALLRKREKLLGPHLSTFYDEPVHIVRGEGVWLWDANGRKYLDCYNNVPHVGHCNPRVVEAIRAQAAKLNTHTRYLHEKILDYAEQLTRTFDNRLSTATLTCTGSEANDAALRMATALTGKRGVIATDYTYHGNTAAVFRLSKGAERDPDGHVRFVPAPDSYRPLGGEAGMAHAHAFANKVAERISELESTPHGFAAAIVCPRFINEGFPDLPDGWLKPTEEVVRKAGGVFIADEVQSGFGRIGTHMWAHQRQGIAPDMVTLGKPMANGHPVGAVVATAEATAAFRKSCRYFNTFGGNPVSCAAATAVLEELEEKNLMGNAKQVGDYAKAKMGELAKKHQCIGDVRGTGLIFGTEMVLDRETKEPATEFTDRLVNEMRRQGVLLGKLGRYGNTLKIRPPMPFSKENADLLLDTLDRAMESVHLQQ